MKVKVTLSIDEKVIKVAKRELENISKAVEDLLKTKLTVLFLEQFNPELKIFDIKKRRKGLKAEEVIRKLRDESSIRY